ncbi:winged helix-turn-helix transcriptional regulator [Microlunatus flavus]|uniref:DNA-binding transcriptional regulator, HxlR family n=1 Tax=Microlunatus flavus TaxID=1036181 RepID=A0A1H9DES0_9ACTN|nr:helix-turn-helix domain-containing protein [Microlunatus flavus]SEQ11964.1 DNA-binding transcriptional regulator, HxlR family [Microlunatus flavus]
MTQTAGAGQDVTPLAACDAMPTCAEVAPTVVRCDAALSHVFAILGKRWNGIIVGALSAGPASFSQLGRAVTGISDSVLSDRLSGLADAGIVRREVESGPPVSVTYALTEAGRALLPAMDELRRWAEEHMEPSA